MMGREYYLIVTQILFIHRFWRLYNPGTSFGNDNKQVYENLFHL